jgi:hypothetical protein
MEYYKKKNVKTDVLIEIICDHCGRSCEVEFGSGNYEFMKLDASWGYGSKKDFEKWSAHLCEKCVDELFNNPKNKKSIRIKFEVQDLTVGIQPNSKPRK